MEHTTGCLVCGRDLVYLDGPRRVTCTYCGETEDAEVICPEGHFICDRCHSLSALDLIERYCERTTDTDPLAIACTLMQSPAVRMHGPEHHFLVPAVLLAAYYNHTGEPEMKAKMLPIAKNRAEAVKGGFCGTHGTCGAAMGTGIFISLITGATPVKQKEWSLANQMTARSLMLIARHGGPRCCKRNSWLAITAAVTFLSERFGIDLPVRTTVRCSFSAINRECLGEACPFNPAAARAVEDG